MGHKRRSRKSRLGWRWVHRRLGVASLVFVLWLSVSGIAMNHASAWGLDRRFIDAPWLLAWYGIEAPKPAAAYAVDGRWAVLLGERLYLDSRPIADGVDELTGAVATSSYLVIGAAHELLVLTRSGELVERIESGGLIGDRIDAIGVREGRLVCRSGTRYYAADENVVTLLPSEVGPQQDVRWSRPGEPPAESLAEARRAYRGQVLTVERFLADLHSGRLLARPGSSIVDVAALMLIVLSITGLIMWSRRVDAAKR